MLSVNSRNQGEFSQSSSHRPRPDGQASSIDTISTQQSLIAASVSDHPASDEHQSRQTNTEGAGEVALEDRIDYGTRIEKYASRTQDKCYLCGSNFRGLADFINSRHMEQLTDNANAPSPVVVQPFAALLCFLPSGSFKLHEFNDVRDFRANAPRANEQTAQLLFLRGYPSAEWIKVVGSRYKVDGEIFRRHMDFLQLQPYYDLPALPTTSGSMFQLRFASICRRRVPMPEPELKHQRQNSGNIVQRHHRNLGRGLGDSIVRQYNVHDVTHFSIEQTMSIYVAAIKKHGWTGIIWLDTGRPLNPEDWTSTSMSTPNQVPTLNNPAISCIPTIRYPEGACLEHGRDEASDADATTNSRFATSIDDVQTASILPFQYATGLDVSLARIDVGYALSELFSFSAACENQFINLLNGLVDEALKHVDTEEEQSLETLRHCSGLLDSHIAQNEETLEVFRRFDANAGTTGWPAAVQPKDVATIKDKHKILLSQYGALVRRSERLADRCARSANYIVSSASVHEARDSKDQSRKVENLSILAFIFIPVAFVCTFFGMNFKEFGQGHLSIWVFFAVGLPVIIVSTIYSLWSRVRLPLLGRYQRLQRT